MRKYETHTREVKESILAETTCDLCGAVAKSGEWDSSMWEVNESVIEVEIRQKDGASYPEGGSGTDYNVDMCPKCFKEKLIPWLESQGSTSKRTDWDW